jgi:hypothetical protein
VTTTPGASASALHPSSHCPDDVAHHRAHALGRVVGHQDPARAVGGEDVRGEVAEAAVDQEGGGVDHGERRVEVHELARARHLQGEHAVGGARGEQAGSEVLDALRRRALAEPDEDRPVPDDEDVPALDVRRSLGRAGGPAAVRAGEPGVPPVDRLVVDGLAHARRVPHGVHRDAVVDPAGRVAGEQVVGQRAEQEGLRAAHVQREAVDAAEPLRSLPPREAGDEQVRELPGGQGLGVLVQGGRERRAEPLGGEGRVQHVRTGEALRERLGQQVHQVVDAHAVLRERGDEGVVLVLRALVPQQVVPQQVPHRAGGEAGELGPGPVDDHLAERVHLRTDVRRGQGTGGTGGRRGGRTHARNPAPRRWVACGVRAAGCPTAWVRPTRPGRCTRPPPPSVELAVDDVACLGDDA